MRRPYAVALPLAVFAFAGCLRFGAGLSEARLAEKRYTEYFAQPREALTDPKVTGEVEARMKAILLPPISFTPKDNLMEAILFLQKASAADGGKPLLFAVRPPVEKGEHYPFLCRMWTDEPISLFEAFRLIVDCVGAEYLIRDDGVIALKPIDWACDDGGVPGKTWLFERGHWPIGL